jgi:hypothetical protein
MLKSYKLTTIFLLELHIIENRKIKKEQPKKKKPKRRALQYSSGNRKSGSHNRTRNAAS